MGENVREMTPIEQENAELKAQIEALKKELKEQKEVARISDMYYHEEKERVELLTEKVEALKEAIVAQALCVRDYMNNDDRL